MQVGAVSYVTGSVASFELYLRFLAKLLGKVNLFPSVSLLPAEQSADALDLSFLYIGKIYSADQCFSPFSELLHVLICQWEEGKGSSHLQEPFLSCFQL